MLTRTGPKPLAEIQFGEDVQTMQGNSLGFSPVLLFAARKVTGQHKYHDITLSSGHQIKASDSHFLHMGGRTFEKAHMVPATKVAVGDRLWVTSSGSMEAAIAMSTKLVNKTGAVSIHTGSNALIVGGVAAYELTSRSPCTSVSVYKLVRLPLRAVIRLLPRQLSYQVISLLHDTADAAHATVRTVFTSPSIVGIIWSNSWPLSLICINYFPALSVLGT